jgi:hypothetical protein
MPRNEIKRKKFILNKAGKEEVCPNEQFQCHW